MFAERDRAQEEETFELPAAARDRFLTGIGMELPGGAEIRRALMFDPGIVVAVSASL